jgi:hypothetical protein
VEGVGASERSRKLTISAEHQYFLSLLVDAAEIHRGFIRIGAFQAQKSTYIKGGYSLPETKTVR